MKTVEWTRWEVFFVFIDFFPALSPRMFISRRLRDRAPFPFNHPGTRYFFLGRNAIYAVAKLWNLAGEEILFPDYFEGVELEALLAAGARPRFYPVRDRMHVEIEDVIAEMGHKTRAIFLIHYLGFPGPVVEFSRICQERNLLLIEDCAHALLSCLGERPLGSFGDASIFSLHKTLPVAGGALVLRRGSSTLPEQKSSSLLSTLGEVIFGLDRYFKFHERMWAHSVIMKIAHLSKTMSRGLGWVSVDTPHFSTSHSSLGMSRLSSMLLAAQDFAAIVERRRRNYLHLMNRLSDLGPPLFDELPRGVCPLAYPFETRNKQAVLMRLKANGVHAANFWCKHHPAGPKAPSAEVAKLRRSVLALPCHQDLTPEAIEMVAQYVHTAVQEVN